MTPRVSFIALYCRSPEECLKFYSEVGFTFLEEKHGSGPVHWSSVSSDGLVIEIYSASESSEDSTTTQNPAMLTLGLEVESVSYILNRADNRYIVRRSKERPDGMFAAVLKDPEGRRIFLSSTIP